MTYNFDQLIERRASGCAKWNYYDADVLPMWVADMDFQVAPAITAALRAQVEHGVFGYALPPAALAEAICARLLRLYNWDVTPEQIVYFPGVVTGFNVAARALGEVGDGLLLQPPVYPPILHAPECDQRELQAAPLTLTTSGNTLRYEVDFDAFEAAITERTRLFLLCNPHNPVGRTYTRDELARMAAICERHNVMIASDEIWSDLVLGDNQHIPIASLSPKISARTITLMAPSKTFNVPGLSLSFAIIQNPELRAQIEQAALGILPLTNMMGSAAGLAAYTEGQDWLTAMRGYLTGNRDAIVTYLAQHLPQMRVTVPEASYLAWIDCRAANVGDNPYTFFLEQAKIAFTNGAEFGPGGQGFVRINFACPRATLMDGLERMRQAVERAG